MRKHHFAALCAVILMAFSVSGCLRVLDEEAVNLHDPAGTANVTGIASLFDTHKRINVLMVHGMGGYATTDGVSDAASLPAYLGQAMNLPQKSYSQYFKTISDPDRPHVAAGYLSRYGFIEGDRELIVYVLFWQPSVIHAKNNLDDIDEQEWIQQTRLTKYHGVTKTRLMNGLLVDAILYTGIRRKAIDHVFNGAVDAIAQDSAGDTPANVIVSFSLGSMITAKNINELQAASAVPSFTGNLCKIYLLANQIALLDLGVDESHKLPVGSMAAYESLASIGSNEKCSTPKSPWVVSVSDPNDILSYPIDPAAMAKHPYTYADFSVSIADKAILLPFTWDFWVINPLTAHQGYATNHTVRRLLIDGYAYAR